jgi:hypothetical protein
MRSVIQGALTNQRRTASVPPPPDVNAIQLAVLIALAPTSCKTHIPILNLRMQVSLLLLEKLNPEKIFKEFLTLDFCFYVEIETFQDEKFI